MLFNAHLSKLEKRHGKKVSYYVAQSTNHDKSCIIFFEPKDNKLLDTVNMLSEHNERLKDYDFFFIYRQFKDKYGIYQGSFRLVDCLCNDVGIPMSEL